MPTSRRTSAGSSRSRWREALLGIEAGDSLPLVGRGEGWEYSGARPSAGDVNPRGYICARRTPTLYPSPQGGGGRQRRGNLGRIPMTLPDAAAPFLGFARHLRRFGFAVAPEQVVAFMRAVELLGPRGMEDIRQAALATLAPHPDRRGEFEALFRSFFHGETAAFVGGGDDEDETHVKDDGGVRSRSKSCGGRKAASCRRPWNS
jgi:hypothetical protein